MKTKRLLLALCAILMLLPTETKAKEYSVDGIIYSDFSYDFFGGWLNVLSGTSVIGIEGDPESIIIPARVSLPVENHSGGVEYASVMVESISNDAFKNCKSLKSITLSSSTSRGIIGNPFSYCTNLTSIIVEGYPQEYQGCNAIITDNVLVAGCKSTTIPENIVAIGDYAFQGCTTRL